MIKIAYVVGKISDMTVPVEVADEIKSIRGISLKLFSYYDSKNSSLYSGEKSVLGAKSKFDIKGAVNLLKEIKKYSPDIVHINHTISSLLLSIYGALSDYKILKTEHNNHKFYKISQKVSAKIILALSDRIICNSFNTKSSFTRFERAVSKGKTGVVYNGVNIKRVEEEGDWKSIEGGGKICSVGRMIEQKNYKRLVGAISSCSEKVEKITIVGSGRNMSDIKKEVKRLKKCGTVNLKGKVRRKEVYREVYRSDIFVMPSLWEGFCNAVVEAMVAGRVIVCSDIPTLREVVGPCGLYFDPTSVSSMAATLDKALQLNHSERAERGRSSRERAVEKFDMKESARKYVRHYRELAGRT